MIEAVSWPAIGSQEELEETAPAAEAEIIPFPLSRETLEDIKMSHDIVWHIGELELGVERIEPATVEYIGPSNSTIVKFDSYRDRMTFLEVLGVFETTRGNGALDLFPIESTDYWQIMTYGCDPELREQSGSDWLEEFEQNRQRKKDFDTFLDSLVQKKKKTGIFLED